MKSFFQRVLPQVFSRLPPAVFTPEPVPSAPAAKLPEAGLPKAPTAMAVRRPLISASGDVAGFEFCVDRSLLKSLQKSEDVQAQCACAATLLIAARLVAMKGRIGFARLPATWLVHVAVPKNESGTWIGLESDADAVLTPDMQVAVVSAAQQFRAAGATLVWGPALDLGTADFCPDFLLLEPTALTVEALLENVKARAPALFHLPVILTNIPNLEDLELALQSGVSYASVGVAPSAPVAVAVVANPDASATKGRGDAQPLPPEVSRMAQLLNQLSSGVDTGLIVSAIKGDIGLSFRLLQRMSSASFAQLDAAASIDQAVLLLGRNELQRWLSLMLMQFSGIRKAGSALQEIALWRSRLVELLAMEQGEAEPGQFFTLGLASMLNMLLNTNTAEIVKILSLPPFAAQALLEHTGPWHVYLRTAALVEAQNVTEAQAVADGFGSAARVIELSDAAWAWAAANADRSKR